MSAVKTQPASPLVRRGDIIAIALATGALLLIPLVAMQLTSDVTWTLADFVAAGTLLFTTGVILSVAMRKFSAHRVIVAAAIAVVFAYVWAELAVGIFTNLGS